MNAFVAMILGVVEGLTEYLPISSTGHLILFGALLEKLGQKSEGSGSFDIVIQLGAVLAVVVQYRELLGRRVRGLLVRDRAAIDLVMALAAGFVPTAVAGLLFRKAIKAHLFGPLPVAAALVVGGIVMIVVERLRKAHARGEPPGLVGLEHVTPKRALLIGLGQCFSLWPGTSRSMCTILAGQATGLSTATSAEFSFLLALPTLGAACAYEAYKGRHELAQTGAANVAIGFVVSFFVAWVVIAAFVKYLQKRGLEPFGYYRIALGLVVLFTLGMHA
jgi:undecaprenyl-diphosphatase